MNTRQSSAYSGHDEIWLLIPWYANGSLGDSERARVKAHLQACLVCRRELANQAMLAKQLEQTPQLGISCKPSFERLMSRIHGEEAIKANRNSQTQDKAQWLENLNRWLFPHFTPKHLSAVFATGLLAIALALLFSGTPFNEIKTYHTVANSNSLDRFTTSDIRVIFADQVTEREIGKLIGSIQGNIVDGPNPAGVYTIRVADGMPLTQALNQLRGNKSIIFAEPALPQAGKPNGGGG